MVTPGKKPNVGNNQKIFRNIDEYIKNQGYGYYSSDRYSNPIGEWEKERLKGLNCSDFDDEEWENRLKGAFVREHIMRKATPEELEWIREQEPVTDPEVLEELRPALEWLRKYAGFGEE